MTTTTQQTQTKALAPAVSKVSQFSDLLRKKKDAIAQVMPKFITPERLLKVALNCYEKTPKLQECTDASVFQCITACAELGLEPGGALGGAYLVPYKNTCTLIIGYRGLIELAHRSGKVVDVRAVVVHAKDHWHYTEGLTQHIEHVPSDEVDPGQLVRVYCVVTLSNGLKHAEVMSRAQVDSVKARSKTSDSGPWVSDYEEMARKTVVRRALKTIPLSPEIRDAVDREEEDVVDGELVAAPAQIETARDRTVRRVKIQDVTPEALPAPLPEAVEPKTEEATPS